MWLKELLINKIMWEKIKKILQKEGGNCIIVEDNQPAYLVMKLEDYEKLIEANDEIEKANRDIDQWQAEEKGKEIETDKSNHKEVSIEDLPF